MEPAGNLDGSDISALAVMGAALGDQDGVAVRIE